MVLKKNKTDNSTLFIDASREFVKVTNKNKLSEDNIENILKLFIERKNVDYVSKVVPNSEIEAQEYNLSVNTYVEREDTREIIDIAKLNKEITEIVSHESHLRTEIDKIIAEIGLPVGRQEG